MRDYGLVPTHLWTNPKIRQLSDGAKLLAIYLLTGPHTNMLGCFHLPIGYVATDLHWTDVTVSKRLQELSTIGFISFYTVEEWVVIHEFLTWNPIENPNQGKAIVKLFEKVPKDSGVFKDLVTILINKSNRFSEEFYVKLQTLSEPFRNQEQKQEQEQDQKKDQNSEEIPNRISLSNSKKLNACSISDTELQKNAKTILSFLNQKTDRVFRAVDTNLKLITARLRSGATVEQCHQIIAKKTREWKNDPNMQMYLRPATLFNATKFEQYLGELLITPGGNKDV